MSGLSITVAICTWNRSRQLARALAHLSESAPTAASWDVLVVNNASTDDTSQVIASFRDRLPIRETREAHPGISPARNRALAEAGGSHVLFIDDDVLVDVGWLATCARLAAAHPDCAVLAGPVRPLFQVRPENDLLAAFPYLRRGFCGVDLEQPEGVLQTGQLPAGANMGFRLDAVKGMRFSTDLGTVGGRSDGHEDLDFVRRVYAQGGKMVWSPQMSVQHYVPESRMAVDYLLNLEERRARSKIRSSPPPSAPTFGGVPAATLLGNVAARAMLSVCSLAGFRRQELIWRVRSRRFRAKAAEYRAQRRRHSVDPPGHSPAPPPDR